MFDISLYDEEDWRLIELFDVDVEAGEILTGFATSGRSREMNLCVAVNPDDCENAENTAYFKLYNHIDPTEATRIARISFSCPEYVVRKTGKGKAHWILSDQEKQNLVKFLESPSKKYEGITVWETLIIDFNYETGLDPDETKRNKTDNPLYPKYLPIDLRMPDYFHSAFTTATHDKK